VYKLTENDILTIRKRCKNGESSTQIAEDYKISFSAVYEIIRNGMYIPSFELKIVKNTLPYIQPYSITAKTITGNNGHYVERYQIIGNYKNKP